MKTCKDCFKILPIDDFYRNPGSRDGYQHYCKDCSKARKRESTHRRGIYKRHLPNNGPNSGTPRTGVKLPNKTREKIIGPLPSDTEAAIYVLKNLDGDIFYVGSTTKPGPRLQGHMTNLKDEKITMEIQRCVLRPVRYVEEMRSIIEFYDSGCQLVNKGVPAPSH